MDVTTIILGIVLIVLLYILYQYLTTDKALLQDYVHLQSGGKEPITDLEKPTTTRYAYGFWIYVNTWDMSNEKIVFSRDKNIEVYLSKTTASMTVKMYTGPNGSTSENIQMSDNFPLQKWVHVIVSVDNEYIDCYLDGKLVRSSKIYTPPPADSSSLPTIPREPSGNDVPIILGPSGGFDAYVARFKRWIYPINPQTAYDEYMKGNGQNSWTGLPNYGLDLKVLKDNEVYKELSVF